MKRQMTPPSKKKSVQPEGKHRVLCLGLEGNLGKLDLEEYDIYFNVIEVSGVLYRFWLTQLWSFVLSMPEL